MSEVSRGFEHHSLLERRVLYTLVITLSSLLIWLESSRILLAMEEARTNFAMNVNARYGVRRPRGAPLGGAVTP